MAREEIHITAEQIAEAEAQHAEVEAQWQAWGLPLYQALSAHWDINVNEEEN